MSSPSPNPSGASRGSRASRSRLQTARKAPGATSAAAAMAPPPPPPSGSASRNSDSDASSMHSRDESDGESGSDGSSHNKARPQSKRIRELLRLWPWEVIPQHQHPRAWSNSILDTLKALANEIIKHEANRDGAAHADDLDGDGDGMDNNKDIENNLSNEPDAGGLDSQRGGVDDDGHMRDLAIVAIRRLVKEQIESRAASNQRGVTKSKILTRRDIDRAREAFKNGKVPPQGQKRKRSPVSPSPPPQNPTPRPREETPARIDSPTNIVVGGRELVDVPTAASTPASKADSNPPGEQSALARHPLSGLFSAAKDYFTTSQSAASTPARKRARMSFRTSLDGANERNEDPGLGNTWESLGGSLSQGSLSAIESAAGALCMAIREACVEAAAGIDDHHKEVALGKKLKESLGTRIRDLDESTDAAINEMEELSNASANLEQQSAEAAERWRIMTAMVAETTTLDEEKVHLRRALEIRLKRRDELAARVGRTQERRAALREELDAANDNRKDLLRQEEAASKGIAEGEGAIVELRRARAALETYAGVVRAGPRNVEGTVGLHPRVGRTKDDVVRETPREKRGSVSRGTGGV